MMDWWPFFYASCSSWRPNGVPMKPSTVLGSRPGMPSVGEQAGCSGWRILAGAIAWDAGFHLLRAVTPVGAVTSFGFGAANIKDQPLAEMGFALRCRTQLGLPMVGAPAVGLSMVNKGFEEQANPAVWQQTSSAQVIHPPKRRSRRPWPKALRRGRGSSAWRNSVQQALVYFSLGLGTAP